MFYCNNVITVTSETGVHASISGPAFDSVNSSVEFDVNFVYSVNI